MLMITITAAINYFVFNPILFKQSNQMSESQFYSDGMINCFEPVAVGKSILLTMAKLFS